MSKAFIDTYVIVYANDAAETARQNTAISLITRALTEGWGVVSTQVVMEYAAVASTRLGQPRDAVTRQTFLLERLEVVSVSPEIIRNALEFAAGRRYAGIDVRNPFA